MKLVIGLGNPGEQYIGTRHNLGFKVLDELVKESWPASNASRSDAGWEESKKLKSQIIKIDQIIFAKPQTYVNNSGLAVRLLSDYYKIVPENIIIIHDELDLSLGKIKVRMGGAAAGHHGVESVIDALNTDQFIRVRLGIGSFTHLSPEKFVLEQFTHSEKPQVKHMIKQVIKALDLLLEKGLDVAQNQFN